MLATVAHALLGLLLFLSAGAKLRSPQASRAALATYGIATARGRAVAWGAAVALELALGAGVALGSAAAAWGAAALCAAFALLLVGALRAGRAGEPCGCLGPRSRVSRAGATRAAVLAVAFAALPFVPQTDLAATGWLAIGLVLLAAAVVALGVLVVALAREVGELRLALGPQPALEIPGEGPPLGVQVEAIERFELGPATRFAVAVFSSDGCPMCEALAPSIRLLGNDPLLAVERFDEHADADVWRALGIPGSPYALVLGLDGSVLAQGTFNSLRQLESLVATAERRELDLFESLHV